MAIASYIRGRFSSSACEGPAGGWFERNGSNGPAGEDPNMIVGVGIWKLSGARFLLALSPSPWPLLIPSPPCLSSAFVSDQRRSFPSQPTGCNFCNFSPSRDNRGEGSMVSIDT